MKYCSHCGTKLNDDAAFCGNCGTKQAEIFPKSNLSDAPRLQQGFQQPVHTQYPQQGYPPFNPVVLTIRFKWPKPKKTAMLFTLTPWFNNLNVEINGVKQTPGNGIKFKHGFVVDVPFTSVRNIIECWTTTLVVKKTSPFHSNYRHKPKSNFELYSGD